MSDVAFVDASPLILLALTGRIELLRCVATSVLVPSAVANEALARAADQRTAHVLQGVSWIGRCADPAIPDVVGAWDLGAGESSVLAHTLQTPRSIAVIDDLAARRCAASLRLDVIGTLGVVVRARRLGWVAEARSVIRDLRAAGLYVADDVADRVLREVGE